MKNLLILALSTVAMSASAQSFKDPQFYWGANYSAWQAAQTEPNIDANFTLYTLEGIVGANLYPHVSVEARAGFGLGSNSESINGTQVEFESPYFASFYFRPYLENDKASLYGLIGGSIMDIKLASPSAEESETESGLSLGLGISFAVNRNADFRAEWKTLVNSDATDVRGGTIGFSYDF